MASVMVEFGTGREHNFEADDWVTSGSGGEVLTLMRDGQKIASVRNWAAVGWKGDPPDPDAGRSAIDALMGTPPKVRGVRPAEPTRPAQRVAL